MTVFTTNTVLSNLYQWIQELFAAGDPTATVYMEPEERPEVDFSTTSEIVLRFESELPYSGDDCGYRGMWDGIKQVDLTVIILARDRYTAQSVWDRLETFLRQGQFAFGTLTPVGQPHHFYVTLRGVRRYPDLESELYGLHVSLSIFLTRNFGGT